MFAWLNAFLNQPIDLLLYQLTVTFGWISTALVVIWGFIMLFRNARQGNFMTGLQYVLLAINVPSQTEQTPKALESLFSNLIGTYSSFNWRDIWITGKLQATFSFEIVSTEGYIQFLVYTQTRFRDLIEASVYAHYPEAEISEVEDYAAIAPHHFPDEDYDGWGAEMTLKKDDHFPIRTYVDFEDKLSSTKDKLRDPLGQILELLGKMRPGEHFWIQFLVQPAGTDWQKRGIDYVTKLFGNEKPHKPGALASAVGGALSIPNAILQEATGISLIPEEHHKEQDIWKSFKLTPIEKEQAEAVVRKAGKLGYPTKVRMAYLARKAAYNKPSRVAMIKAALQPYSHLNLNSFTMHGPSIPKDDFFWQRWGYAGKQTRLFNAYRKRSWGTGATPRILNVEELATLWHFPNLNVKAPLVQKAEAKRGEPPTGLPIDTAEYGMAPLAPKAHDGHGGGHAAHAEAAHAPEAATSHAPVETAPIELPGLDAMDAPVSHDAPAAVAGHPPAEEESEPGLDAEDMGPPADVELPGPPPGWKEEAESGDEAPPNLPV
jgi:hypothetical protein